MPAFDRTSFEMVRPLKGVQPRLFVSSICSENIKTKAALYGDEAYWVDWEHGKAKWIEVHKGLMPSDPWLEPQPDALSASLYVQVPVCIKPTAHIREVNAYVDTGQVFLWYPDGTGTARLCIRGTGGDLWAATLTAL
jgi:hypothetical protein